MPVHRREKGFTLIEAIAILIVLGILAAIAFSRMTTGDISLRAQAEALKSHIRYAQLRAMNADADTTTNPNCESSFGISTSGTAYFLFKNCDTTSRVILPGAENDSISLPSGMTLNATATNVTFDKWGEPCLDLNGTNLATANIGLTLSYAGQPEPITITKNTGFVP